MWQLGEKNTRYRQVVTTRKEKASAFIINFFQQFVKTPFTEAVPKGNQQKTGAYLMATLYMHGIRSFCL